MRSLILTAEETEVRRETLTNHLCVPLFPLRLKMVPQTGLSTLPEDLICAAGEQLVREFESK